MTKAHAVALAESSGRFRPGHIAVIILLPPESRMAPALIDLPERVSRRGEQRQSG
jgi:hypothetical protein